MREPAEHSKNGPRGATGTGRSALPDWVTLHPAQPIQDLRSTHDAS